MADLTALNDAVKDNVLIVTTPLSAEEMKEEVKALQSKSTSGNYPTTDIVKAFVAPGLQGYVDDWADQLLSYLSTYDGNNKRCSVVACQGHDATDRDCNVFQSVRPTGIIVVFQLHTLPMADNYKVVFTVTWD